ncbi:glycosyltransferase [Mesorhizobium sp. M1163]|uniref:glycosyltransferase n=1 Tax=Mesorhizobium sp. M1163 TaxID=2957065 RepID=UPI003338FBF5
MKIIQISPLVEAEANGPSYSVPALCAALTRLGHSVTLMTVSSAPSARSFSFEYRSYPQLGRSNQLLWSPGLARALISDGSQADIIHNHNIWGFPPIYAAQAANRNSKPLVVAPRGTFSPIALERSRYKKKIFWTVLQRKSIMSASCLQATSEQEFEDIRSFGLRTPIALIPNGIDVLERPILGSREAVRARRVLYLGRIHPIKGLENLLIAWDSVSRKHPAWELRLVGPDEQRHRTVLEALAKRLRLPRVTFCGPVFGEHKTREFAEADLCILPSFSENFGMVVAEALAHAVPVITTTRTPWSGLVGEQAGWWIAPEPSAIAAALDDAFSKPAGDLESMGCRGEKWMRRDFSWDAIGRSMVELYQWLLLGDTKPSFVRTE